MWFRSVRDGRMESGPPLCRIGRRAGCRSFLLAGLYFSFFQLVWLNRALLLGSNDAVDEFGVLNPELW